MKGLVFTGNRELELQDFDDPTPGPGEVVIEIKASGMCGSDLHIYRSPGGGPGVAAALGLGGDGKPKIGGHEPCGVVMARGEGDLRDKYQEEINAAALGGDGLWVKLTCESPCVHNSARSYGHSGLHKICNDTV